MCKTVAPTGLQTVEGEQNLCCLLLEQYFCVTLNERRKVQDEVRQTASTERVN